MHADEPGMVEDFDRLGKQTVGRAAGEDDAVGLQALAIGVVDLVAVAMALGNILTAINLRDLGIRAQMRGISAKTHGAA